jgi:hypothetical protein
MATGIGPSSSFSLSLFLDHYSGKQQPQYAAASRAGLIAHKLVLPKSTNCMKSDQQWKLDWHRGICFL